VGQGGATLASPHPDTGRSPAAFKVQALARCTWVSSLPLPPDKPTPAHTQSHSGLAKSVVGGGESRAVSASASGVGTHGRAEDDRETAGAGAIPRPKRAGPASRGGAAWRSNAAALDRGNPGRAVDTLGAGGAGRGWRRRGAAAEKATPTTRETTTAAVVWRSASEQESESGRTGAPGGRKVELRDRGLSECPCSGVVYSVMSNSSE